MEASHETDEKALSENLIAIKEVAGAMDIENYNILQSNGKMTHQEVMHAHFHLIPKNSASEGLKFKFNHVTDADQEKIAEQVRKSLQK